jgi:hypothetical protein
MATAALVRVPAIAVGAHTLLGLGLSVLVPIAFAVAARSSTHAPVAAISRLAATSYAALFVGPPVIGLVSTWIGLRTALVALAALLFAVAVIVSVTRVRV